MKRIFLKIKRKLAVTLSAAMILTSINTPVYAAEAVEVLEEEHPIVTVETAENLKSAEKENINDAADIMLVNDDYERIEEEGVLVLPYTGTTMAVDVKAIGLDGKELKHGVDYIIDGGNTSETNANTYTVTIKGIGDYAGTRTLQWRIVKHKHHWVYTADGNVATALCNASEYSAFCDYKDSGITLNLKAKNVPYTGRPYDAVQIVASGVGAGTNDEKLDKFNELTDNSVSKIYYQTSTGRPLTKAPVDAGEYIALLDVGNETISYAFVINSNIIDVDDSEFFAADWTYDGQEHSLVNTDKIAEYAPAKGSFSYTLQKDDGAALSKTIGELKAKDAGKYKVTYIFTASGNYAGTQDGWARIDVAAKGITADMVTLSEPSYKYDGAPHLPTITVKDGDYTLVKDTDYTVVTAAEKTEKGIYYYSISGKGNYRNSISKKWTIEAKDLDPRLISVADGAEYIYNGTKQLAAVTVSGQPGAVVKYSTARLGKYTDYAEAKPGDVGACNAGKSRVWYSISIPNYKVYTGSYDLKINPMEISISWNNAEGSTAKDFSYVYNRQAQMPYASAIGLIGGDAVSLVVESDEAVSVGTHTATVKEIKGTAAANYKLPEAKTQSYSIGKADTIISLLPVEKKAIPYSGKAECALEEGAKVKSVEYPAYGQASVSVDYVDATVEYAVTKKGTPPSDDDWVRNWEDVKVKDAGDYTVRARTVADTNHNASETVSAEVTVGVGKFKPEDFAAKDELEYNGQAQTPELIVDSKYDGAGYTVMYGQSDGSYSLNYDALVEALNTVTVSDNEITVYYQVEMPNYESYAGNYKYKIVERELEFKWEADGKTTAADAFAYKYNKLSQGLKAVVLNAATGDEVFINVTGYNQAAGTHTASIAGIAGKDAANYKLPDTGLTQEFVIEKADITIAGMVVDNTLSYKGIDQTVITTEAAAKYIHGDDEDEYDKAILYSLYTVDAEGKLAEAVITDKTAEEIKVKLVGKYAVVAKAAGDANHNDAQMVSEVITVEPGKMHIVTAPQEFEHDYDGYEYEVAIGLEDVKADVENAVIYFKVTKDNVVLLEKGTMAEVRELSAKAPGEYVVECWAESDDEGYLPSDKVEVVSRINQASHEDESIEDTTVIGTIENNIAIHLGAAPDGMIYGTPSANSIKIESAEIKEWMESPYLIISMKVAAERNDKFVITVPVVDDPQNEEIAGYTDYSIIVTITAIDCSHRKIKYHKAVAATCTEDGNDEYWECSECGMLFKTLSPTVLYGGIPFVWAAGHTVPENNEITIDVAPTCTSVGRCSVRCTVCGEKLYEDIIEKVPHEYEAKEIIAAPTAVNTGLQNYVCKHCGMQMVKELPTISLDKNSYEELAEALLKKMTSEDESDSIIAYQTDTDTAALAINYQKGRPKRFLVTALNGLTEATVTIETGMKKIYLPGKGYNIVSTTCARKLKLKDRKKDADTALEIKKSKTNYEVVVSNGTYKFTIYVRALSFDKDLRKLVLNSDEPDASEVVYVSPLNGEGITGGVWTVGNLLLSKLDTEYYVTAGKAVVKVSVNIDGSLTVRPVSGNGKVKIIYTLNGVKYQTSVKLSDRELKDSDYDYRAKFGLK